MTRPLRIAIADDEPELRQYLRRILPRLGHEVVAVAADGSELVELCRATQPDLVITDIKMPKLDGLSALDEICRSQPRPTIVISAHEEALSARNGCAQSVAVQLVKPINRSQLATAIDRAIERFDLASSLAQRHGENELC
jgi:response regulator NasT